MSGMGSMSGSTAYYCIWDKLARSVDTYWVDARSHVEARRLIAASVPEASRARNVDEFECVLNDDKEPPLGMIYCRLNGPVAVKR